MEQEGLALVENHSDEMANWASHFTTCALVHHDNSAGYNSRHPVTVPHQPSPPLR